MKTGKRHIKNGHEFNHLFPKVKGEFQTIKKFAQLDDTIHLMKNVVATTLTDTLALSKRLTGTTLKQTCSNIWHFCFNHLQYTKDELGKEQVRRPARTWQDRKQGVDCDCMSVFIGSILSNLNIPFSFRITKYTSDEFEHVYVIVPTENEVIILDAVVHAFNREVQYTTKKDISMELQYLNGINDGHLATDDFDDFDEIIENDFPMDAQSLIMEEDLLGLEGRWSDKRKAKKEARKAKRAEIKTLPKKQRLKARLKQGLHVINKVNPATGLLRLGILASMKLNVMQVASKLRYGYWSDAEAKRNHMDMGKFLLLKRIREKMEKIFFGAGGKTENLKKAILSGKGNRDRKVILNGLGEVIPAIYDEDELRTILGDELYEDEKIEDGINGLGVVATSAAIAAASGVVGTIATLIKKLGSLLKKGTPQAEQEILQANTDLQEEKTRKFSLKNLVSKMRNNPNVLPTQTRSTPPNTLPSDLDEFNDFANENYSARTTTSITDETNTDDTNPSSKKGILEWVKANPLLTAGIATAAIGGTVLIVKNVQGKTKSKGLSGVTKKKASPKKRRVKKSVVTKRRTPPKPRRKRKAPVRRKTVKKVELL
ncbi:MAG: hypothetical protein ACWA41_04515 [Putridiphycobacter sp.]